MKMAPNGRILFQKRALQAEDALDAVAHEAAHGAPRAESGTVVGAVARGRGCGPLPVPDGVGSGGDHVPTSRNTSSRLTVRLVRRRSPAPVAATASRTTS